MFLSKTRRSRPGRPGSRRGFTIAEMMVASAITSFVMVAVASFQYMSARAIKEVSGQTRTRSMRMQALDKIRYRLVNAQIGSCVVGYNGQLIRFVDPNLGGAVSAFFFVQSTNELYYDDDIGDATAAKAIVEGPIDVNFELQELGAVITLRITSASHATDGQVDVEDGETAVYLRNI